MEEEIQLYSRRSIYCVLQRFKQTFINYSVPFCLPSRKITTLYKRLFIFAKILDNCVCIVNVIKLPVSNCRFTICAKHHIHSFTLYHSMHIFSLHEAIWQRNTVKLVMNIDLLYSMYFSSDKWPLVRQ
jgi:hypothetical protein